MTEADKLVFRETLAHAAEAVGVPLSLEQIEQATRYTHRLLEVNEQMNLTRITTPAEVAIKHFADSLTVLPAAALPRNSSVADVGTGAGFPGLVLKIARPDLRLTLIDSVGKRLSFLADMCEALNFTDVALVHARAEDVGHDPKHRDSYDLVVARAVALLPVLLEWCSPLVKVGGQFIALKAQNADEERSAAQNAAHRLYLRLDADTSLTLPPFDGEDKPAARRLITYRKLRPTPPRFPRRPAEIKATPL